MNHKELLAELCEAYQDILVLATPTTSDHEHAAQRLFELLGTFCGCGYCPKPCLCDGPDTTPTHMATDHCSRCGAPPGQPCLTGCRGEEKDE